MLRKKDIHLPALSAARERAKSSQCINKLKQIALAKTAYAGDQKDQLPFYIHIEINNGNDPSRGRHAMDSNCDPGNLMVSDAGVRKAEFDSGINNHPNTINCVYMGGYVKTLDSKFLRTNTASVIGSIPLLGDRERP